MLGVYSYIVLLLGVIMLLDLCETHLRNILSEYVLEELGANVLLYEFL